MILEVKKLSRDFQGNFLIHVVVTWLLASIQLILGHVWWFKGESTHIPGASVGKDGEWAQMDPLSLTSQGLLTLSLDNRVA